MLDGIDDITDEFWDSILIKRDVFSKIKKSSYANSIILKTYAIFGTQGSGKTTTANAIAKRYYDEYGDEDYFGDMMIGSIERLFSPIYNYANVRFADDITATIFKPEWLSKYFKIRHLVSQHDPEIARRGAVLIVLLGIHRLHGIPPELRTNLDGIIIRDIPLFGWDRSFFERLIGSHAAKVLDYVRANRTKHPELYEYSYFYSLKTKGFIKTKMEQELYMIY